MTTPRTIRGLCLALFCLLVPSVWAALPAGAPASPGVTPRSGVVGAGMEVLMDYRASNGNVYDYVLLTGTTATVTADAGQITRVLFIDLDDDIVTVEFSGAGSLTVSLANASGPALPAKYNAAVKFGQPLNYWKGLATLTVQGANATTNVSVFSVGRATEADQTMFRDDVVYDGIADIAQVAIIVVGDSAQFGGLRLDNAVCSTSSGVTGISAANVAFNGPVFIGDIKAYDAAIPMLQLGSASDTRIVGGSLFQPNGKPIIASGITNLVFVAGATSHGVELPAQTNQGQLSQAPAITSGSSASFTVGAAGSFTATATGFPAPTFSVASGSLPSWATLNATTGVIAGTPPDATGSPFTFTLQASNGNGSPATQNFTLTVLAPLVVSPLANQTVTAGNSATWTASASGGGTLTYQWRRDGQPLAGATAASYAIAAVTMFDAGSYDVVVTRGASQVVSGAAVLLVAPTQYPGTMRVDPTFTPSIETDGGYVYALAAQPDGKLIVGGQFVRINGVARSNFARLNTDGTVDATFNPGTGPNDTVWKLVLQPDGKIVLVGDFVAYNKISRSRVVRVNSDGSLDTTFDPGVGANGQLLGVGLQPDGKVLVGGYFYLFDGVPCSNIARLNANGSIDLTFVPGSGASSAPKAFAVQPDGKIIVVGGFERFNGIPRSGVARLNADGSLDTTFVPPTADAYGSNSVALQADGKVLVGAFNFSSSAPNFQRLNTDGSRDTSFNPGANNGTYAIAVQADGKIVAGGRFTQIQGVARNDVARYLTDGTLDATFDPGSAINYEVRALVLQPDGRVVAGGWWFGGAIRLVRLQSSGASDPSLSGVLRSRGTVKAMARQPDGKILLSGEFSGVNGVACGNIARVNTDGALDAGFNPGSGANGFVDMLALQRDGRIVVGGSFTAIAGSARPLLARLNADGTLDPAFDPGTGPDGQLYALALQPDGKIVIGGNFTAYNGVGRKRVARVNANGTLDPSFDPQHGPNDGVSGIAIRNDGRILLAGYFTSYNGASRARLARIMADGSLDADFVPTLPAGSYVYGLLPMPDGKTMVSETATQSVLRLLANGSVDDSFAAGNLSNILFVAGPMLLQADGRLLAGRSLNTSGNTTPPGLARLGTGGAVDTSFSVPGLRDAKFTQILMLEDGSLLVAGARFDDGRVDQTGVARLMRPTTPGFTSATSAAFILGAANTFAVTATGLPAPTFSVSAGALPPWAFLNGATGVISGTPTDATDSPFTFTLQANNGADAVATQSFTLTVIPGAITVAPPATQTVTAGQGATLSAIVTGSGSLTYQWRRDGQPITGATAATYSIVAVTMLDAGSYDVVVTGATGPSIVSATGRLEVAPTRYPTLMKLDPAFVPEIEVAAGVVNAIVRQPDGKLIVGGGFARINGVLRKNLARLNADGSVDTSFSLGRGPDGEVVRILLLPDGKILLGGSFLNYNGVSRGHIARVNADGTLDAGFNPGTGTTDDPFPLSVPGKIEALGLQADGKILLGGWFSSYNGVSRSHLARVNADGSLDTTFNPATGPSGGVFDLVLQPDGKIVVAGYFSSYAGTSRIGVARILADGSLDASFAPVVGASFEARALALQSDGKILVGADSSGSRANQLLRLNADGTRDGTFTAMSALGIYTIVLPGDGKVWAGGWFTTATGAPRNCIARLTADGTLDTSFDPGAGPDFDVHTIAFQPNGQPVIGGRSTNITNVLHSALARLTMSGVLDSGFAGGIRSKGNVEALVRQTDGKFVIAGGFDYVNGVRRTQIARVNADGSLDAAFNPTGTLISITSGNAYVTTLLGQPDGRILVGGRFDHLSGATRYNLGRLQPDGSIDSSFDPGSGPNSPVQSMALRPDGRILLSGYFDYWAGVPRKGLARVNANGSLDLSFDPAAGADYPVEVIAALPNDRVLIGGWFNNYNGISRRGIARLMSDGSLDAGFGSVNGYSTMAGSLLQDPAGYIYAGAWGRVYRLGLDGQVDSGYPATDFSSVGYVGAMMRQADGRLLIGAGIHSSSDRQLVGIARVNTDGTRDTTFSVPDLVDAQVSSFSLLENGNLIVAGTRFWDGKVDQAGLARLVPIEPATLSSQPQSQTGVVGGAATLSVTATGDGPFTYQWRKGGVALPGATDSTFTIAALASADAGNYTVDVTNSAGTTTSSVGVLTVNPAVPPTITTPPLSQSVSLGAGFTLRVVPGGSAPFTYQWYLGATPLPGATHDSYAVAATQASHAGSYTVVVTNVADSVTSNAAVVTILATGFGGTHAVVGPGYASGQTVTVTNTITYAGEVSALGWQVLLPAGWSYASGGGAAADLAPRAGDTGFLEWAWTTIPASPITFTYTLNVPAGTNGPQAIAALMLPRQAGTQHTLLVKPDPLVIEQVTRHSADTNGDGRLSLNELLRVIELYNTRNGTVRTGAYALDANNLEDGFTTAPARLNTDSVTLLKYHSADSNHDGKLDLNELLRVIELYNHRNGTVRTGQYHVQANTEDGFATGP